MLCHIVRENLTEVQYARPESGGYIGQVQNKITFTDNFGLVLPTLLIKLNHNQFRNFRVETEVQSVRLDVLITL
jgi:hypothetical protein